MTDAPDMEPALERNIYEVANQLEGYVGPDTPEPLAQFLLREGKEASKLADEIVRLRAARSAPEAGKAVTDTWSSICAHARGDADYARMPLGLTSRAEPLAEQALRRLIYPVSTEINPRGWEFREKPMLEEAVRFLQEASALASVAPSGAEPVATAIVRRSGSMRGLTLMPNEWWSVLPDGETQLYAAPLPEDTHHGR